MYYNKFRQVDSSQSMFLGQGMVPPSQYLFWRNIFITFHRSSKALSPRLLVRNRLGSIEGLGRN